MTDEKAYLLPKRLKRKLHTDNPFEIAEALDITVFLRDDFKHQKGAFKVIMRHSYIFINANLSDEMKRIVCAHELGHALMHRGNYAEQGLFEYDVFGTADEKEYDANVFAANLLIEDLDLLDYIQQGYDQLQIAREFRINVDLLTIKLHEMEKADGQYHFNLPYMPRRDFLGRISDDPGSL